MLHICKSRIKIVSWARQVGSVCGYGRWVWLVIKPLYSYIPGQGRWAVFVGVASYKTFLFLYTWARQVGSVLGVAGGCG